MFKNRAIGTAVVPAIFSNRVLLGVVLCFCIVALLPALVGAQNSDKRFALVIGNAAYSGDAALRNPVNDANDISSALKDIGWKVQLVTNANRRDFNRALAAFRDALLSSPGASAVFFYAGHAMQIEGQNYLLPTQVVFETPDDVKTEAINISSVASAISEGKANISLLILDSCRDNPFVRTLNRSAGGGQRGLSIVQNGGGLSGSAIMFSTAPGEVAQDGTGRNGVFTQALLKHIKSDSRIEDLFRKVNADVRSLTGDKQKPWINASLATDFYFVSDSIRTAQAEEAQRIAQAQRQEELERAAEAAAARALEQARAEAAAQREANTSQNANQNQGRLKVESLQRGEVYLDEVLLGEVLPGVVLELVNLPFGPQTFVFIQDNGKTEEVRINLTAFSINTVTFGQKDSQADTNGREGEREPSGQDAQAISELDPDSQALRILDELGSSVIQVLPLGGSFSMIDGGVFTLIINAPAGMEIYLNDDFVGTTPFRARALRGIYDLELYGEGYETYTDRIRPGVGSSLTVAPELTLIRTVATSDSQSSSSSSSGTVYDPLYPSSDLRPEDAMFLEAINILSWVGVLGGGVMVGVGAIGADEASSSLDYANTAMEYQKYNTMLANSESLILAGALTALGSLLMALLTSPPQ